jgi:hypothetical protein
MRWAKVWLFYCLILLLSLLSGCSVMGQASKAYLTAANVGFQAQPKVLRDVQPVWIKRAYFTSEVMVEPITDWRLQLRSTKPLPSAQLQAQVLLSYQHQQQQFQQQVPLQLLSAQFEQDSQSWHYLYQLEPQSSLVFWQQFQQLLWQIKKPKFNYLLQPEFTGVSEYQSLSLYYQYAQSFGLLSVGDMARLNMAVKDADWVLLCQTDAYRYDKSSACGKTLIKDVVEQRSVKAQR